MHNLSTKKKISIIVGSIVLLVLAGAATTVVLSTVLPKKSDQAANNTASAKQIIQSYSDTYTAGNLQKQYTQQKDGLKNSLIDYNANGAAYATQIAATSAVTYVLNDAKATDSSAVLVSDAEALLVTQGLTKGATTTTNTDSRILYDGRLSACQITTFKAIKNAIVNSPAAFGIGCVDKKSVAAEYSAIDTLLSLYKKTNNLPTVTRVIRNVATNKTTPVTSLYIATNDTKQTSFRAYYVSVNSQQTYIGTQTVPAPTATDHAIVQSSDLKTALANPTYGAFLTQTIEKY